MMMMAKKRKTVSSPTPTWMKLKVGGIMMETTRETLNKFPGSLLAEMVNSTKEEEALSLDLDPEYFRPILNWLRLES